MKLTLQGHDDLYAVEQLQMALFADDAQLQAVSSLHRGKTWLTASTKITLDGKTATASRRIKAVDREKVHLCADRLFVQAERPRVQRVRVYPARHCAHDVASAGAERGEGGFVRLRPHVDRGIIRIVYNRAHCVTP